MNFTFFYFDIILYLFSLKVFVNPTLLHKLNKSQIKILLDKVNARSDCCKLCKMVIAKVDNMPG